MKPTYEELEKQCADLAAENVARGEIIERLIGQYSASGFHAIQNSLNPAQSLLYDALQVMRQPATDAFLAEARAQGMESVGQYLKQYAQGLHEEARLVLQDAGELCNGFAAQLRKGDA